MYNDVLGDQDEINAIPQLWTSVYCLRRDGQNPGKPECNSYLVKRVYLVKIEDSNNNIPVYYYWLLGVF